MFRSKRLNRMILTGTTTALLQACAPMKDAPKDAPQNEAARYLDTATALAGKDFQTTENFLCGTTGMRPDLGPGAPPPPQMPAGPIAPTKVFDNLYYIGLQSVGTWVLNTSDGLILIDSLNSSQEAEDLIVAGLQQLGLDPAQIKIIVLTHGHGDHYGGTPYLVQRYSARVLLAEADWQYLEGPVVNPFPNRPAPPIPKRDLVATDGQKLTLGNTTITLIATPGHTPGTMSILIPITDHGVPHMAALWGGTAIPRDVPAMQQYAASAAKLKTIAQSAGVDIELSPHGFLDDLEPRLNQLRARTSGLQNGAPSGPHPFVIGAAGFARYMGVIEACTRMQVALKLAAQK